ncbi:hypothetical protein C7C46_08920 [Streptomyces tateyamensis]|uniref:Phage head morphogenesis domain-containing protein n=1 Tax=Streptomyces tateyamensis TaxID=565073 RepID=A0A2V4NEX2_9ACTN|nr:hypothetical protein [Streptomyces tateyamensis]PYC83445.1 hypothetical protein C7C46_08920 [Streptomyces tateyamensis]
MADTQTLTDLVAAYGASQRRAVVQATSTTDRLWAALGAAADDLSAAWLGGIGPALVRALTAGQLQAASSGQPYVDAVVSADGEAPDYLPGASRVVPSALAGVATDGRALDSLLYLPVIRTKTLLGGGMTLQQSLLGGLVDLRRIVTSEVTDAGSAAAQVAMTANRTVTGYIRQVRSGACARCIILAGRWYRWSADFQRHKNCQCYGVPATRARPGSPQDPRAVFDRLSAAEQDRRFGAGDAQAIRDGADIFQVVNARRGMTTVDAFGARLAATLEGTSRFGTYYKRARTLEEARTGIRYAHSRAELAAGLPRFTLQAPRLMPAEIYRLTSDRAQQVRLLRQFGYLAA